MSVSIYGILSLGSRPINVKRIVVMRFKLEAHRLFSLVTVLSLVIQDFNHLDGVSWNWAPLNKCEDEGQRWNGCGGARQMSMFIIATLRHV